MAGFEESGLPGKQSIRDGFQGCRDPESFISSFRQENCVLLTSLHPALYLLDLQDVKRVTFHQSIMGELLEKLTQRINEECTEDKLKELLDHIFQFIHVDNLRPIIMATMKKLSDIKPEYIEKIAENDKIYQDCPIEVKRRVWMKKHPLFGDAVGPTLNKYIEEKYSLLYSIENIKTRNFFSVPPRQRRQKTVVKELVQMIGFSIELYNLVLQFLRTLFLRTKEEHYCSLRGELLMAFHDADIKDIRQVDPCHKFTWCLDACIRDKSVDSKRLKELQTFLDGIKAGQEEVMGDIAMIVCDPYASNTIVSSILQQLNKFIRMDMLPRSSQELMFLIRLLTLSTNAWNMLKSQDFKETPMNPDIITKFLPTLMSVMLDCTHGSLNAGTTIVIPESLWEFAKNDAVSETILSYFVNQLLQGNKRNMLEVILPHYARAFKAQPIPSTLMNSMIHSMARHPEQFVEPPQCILLCDQFLFVWLQFETMLHHVLRLLWCVYEKIDSHQLVRLLTLTQPSSQHSETLHDLHARLVDVIASASKASTPSSNPSSVEQNNSLSPTLQLSPARFSPSITT